MKTVHITDVTAPDGSVLSELLRNKKSAYQGASPAFPAPLPPMPYSAGEHAERPWGSWLVLDVMPHAVVKKLTIHPGKRISLQRHRFRSELWTVVDGVADVLCHQHASKLHPGEQILIPQKSLHRLSNNGNTPVTLIEIQFGYILSEEDIERFHDDYGRQSAEG